MRSLNGLGAGLPPLWAAGRKAAVVWVLALALAQVAGAALIAVGVRHGFIALADRDPLPVLVLLLVAAGGLVLALARWGERQVAERLGQRYANELRLLLVQTQARQPIPAGSSGLNPGVLHERLIGDMSAVRLWIGQGFLRLLATLISLAGLGVFLALWMSKSLALGVLGTVLIGLWLMHLLSGSLQPAHVRLRRARSRLNLFVSERLAHLRALRLAGRLGQESELMRQHFERVEEAAVRRRSQQARVQAVADGVRALAIIWVLAAAFMLQLPAADAAACLAVVGLLVQRLRELAGVWDRHAAWVTAKPRLLAGLGGGAGGAVGAVGARGRKSAGSGAEPEGALIELRKVGAGPLQAWSQALYRGDKVCLRGASGSGKTTLLRLLAGSIQPQSGRIQRRPDPAWRGRQWIAHIEAQGPVLSGSLRRALTLGSRPRPSDARILEVVQQLGLHNTLERMGGLDGRVLWSGRNLSDYERRRLLLARAMLATMPVVLIDDLGLGSDPGLAQAMQRWLLSSAATVVWVGFDGVDAGQQARGWDLGPAPRGDTAVVEGQAAETGAEAALSDKPG